MDQERLKRQVLSSEVAAGLAKALGVDTSRAVSMSMDVGTEDVMLVRVAYPVTWAMIAEVASSLANARPVGPSGPRRKAMGEPRGYMMASPEELAEVELAFPGSPSADQLDARWHLRRTYCVYADDPAELAVANDLRRRAGLSPVPRLVHALREEVR